MTDKDPLNMDPETITERDRARLAARRAAEELFPSYGTEAVPKRFSPRGVPDAWALSHSIAAVWRQATYFSPIGDTNRFFPVSVHLDGEGRLHNESGPAMEFSDGFKVYFIRGIEVGRLAIEDPSAIPIAAIRDCKNIEQRRILIERYGRENYIKALGLKPVHKDDFGELYHATIPGDETLAMVKVMNSTPEPCGCGRVFQDHVILGPTCPDCGAPIHYKDYWMCVPFTVRTAREAVAWTFGKDGNTYRPQRET